MSWVRSPFCVCESYEPLAVFQTRFRPLMYDRELGLIGHFVQRRGSVRAECGQLPLIQQLDYNPANTGEGARASTRVSEPAECTASFCTVLLRPEGLPGTSTVVVGFHSFFVSPGAYEIDFIAPSSSPEKKCGMARRGAEWSKESRTQT